MHSGSVRSHWARPVGYGAAAFIVALACCFGAAAIAAGGPPPKKPAKQPPAGSAKQPHRAKKPMPPRSSWPQKAHYGRKPQYWHPIYRGKRPAPRIWLELGYRYYVGGTTYVMTSPPRMPAVGAIEVTGQAEPGPVVEAPADEALDAYMQIQELIEMVHEWRTLNESPIVHERLARAQASPDGDTLRQLRTANERFDRASRVAMRFLAEGRPAEEPLAEARHHLEAAITSVESLPPAATE